MADEPMSDGADGDLYHGIGFWLAVLVGSSAIAYGASEFLAVYPDVERRLDLPRWIIGSALAHDLLLVPLVLLFGCLVSRFVPAVGRAPAQFGCIATGMVLLLAWHPLRRTGASKLNPSIQPLDYRTSTLTVLAVVWGIAAIWTAARWWRSRHGGHGWQGSVGEDGLPIEHR
jgi:hypothetical protein